MNHRSFQNIPTGFINLILPCNGLIFNCNLFQKIVDLLHKEIFMIYFIMKIVMIYNG